MSATDQTIGYAEGAALNRASWDERVATHVAAPSYRVDEIADDPDATSHVVADDVEQLRLDGERFDLVYTGVGALMWLDDIVRWGEVVAACLAPGGTVFVRDVHPAFLALEHTRSAEWNHGLAQIVMVLVDQGLLVEDLGEQDLTDGKPFDLFAPIEGPYEHHAIAADRRSHLPTGSHLRCRAPDA